MKFKEITITGNVEDREVTIKRMSQQLEIGFRDKLSRNKVKISFSSEAIVTQAGAIQLFLDNGRVATDISVYYNVLMMLVQEKLREIS